MPRGEITFRMVAFFHDELSDADWSVNALYRRSRGGTIRAHLTAENVVTGEQLIYPRDYDKLVAVVPEDYWPAFVKELVPPDGANPDQDALWST